MCQTESHAALFSYFIHSTIYFIGQRNVIQIWPIIGFVKFQAQLWNRHFLHTSWSGDRDILVICGNIQWQLRESLGCKCHVSSPERQNVLLWLFSKLLVFRSTWQEGPWTTTSRFPLKIWKQEDTIQFWPTYFTMQVISLSVIYNIFTFLVFQSSR